MLNAYAIVVPAKARPTCVSRATTAAPHIPSRWSPSWTLLPSCRLSRRPSCRSALSIDHISNGRPLPSSDFENGMKSSDFFEIELQVREYELDQYGVVNNAVYSSYCEHAYYQALESLGMGVDAIYRASYIQALKERSLKFVAPLRLVLEARLIIVWLSTSHRPVQVLEQLKQHLIQLGMYKC